MIIIYKERHYSECISSLAKTFRYARKKASSDRMMGTISRNYENSSNQSIGERIADTVCNSIGDGLDYYVDTPSKALTDMIIPIKDDTADKRNTKRSVRGKINKILNKFGIRDKK